MNKIEEQIMIWCTIFKGIKKIVIIVMVIQTVLFLKTDLSSDTSVLVLKLFRNTDIKSLGFSH